VDAHHLPGLGLHFAGRLAIGAGHEQVAMGGNLASRTLLGLAAQLPSQRDRLTLNDAVMRCLQKHPLLGLLLDHQLRELGQKFLLSLLASLPGDIHAGPPGESNRLLNKSIPRRLPNKPPNLLLTFSGPTEGSQKLNWSPRQWSCGSYD